MMHGGAGVLHGLRHIGRHVGGVVQAERAHAEPRLDELGRFVELAVGDVADDPVQA